MPTQPCDIWADWLLHRRYGGDAEQLRATLNFLAPIRERVLDHAQSHPHQTLLDIGAGDGLIALGTLARESTCPVVISDISQQPVEAQRFAENLQSLVESGKGMQREALAYL